MKVSLVVTVKNEAASLDTLFDSMAAHFSQALLRFDAAMVLPTAKANIQTG